MRRSARARPVASLVWGEPDEAGFRVGRRPVLAADPATEAEFVDLLEDEGPVDLTGAGLVAARIIGHLHVRDDRQVLLHPLDDVALGDLAVVKVELQAEPLRPDRLDDR